MLISCCHNHLGTCGSSSSVYIVHTFITKVNPRYKVRALSLTNTCVRKHVLVMCSGASAMTLVIVCSRVWTIHIWPPQTVCWWCFSLTCQLEELLLSISFTTNRVLCCARNDVIHGCIWDKPSLISILMVFIHRNGRSAKQVNVSIFTTMDNLEPLLHLSVYSIYDLIVWLA